MKITDLRALATWHAQAANNATSAALGMGECFTKYVFLEQAEKHKVWHEQLEELAQLFETFGHVIGDQ